ncbi:MAG: cation:proton antiporter [Cyanobacteria bacterium HKST-UBA02]|nr:cation:proton antiporter [Cyanobacteria bacterium HKST-UBA02]
MDVSLAILGIGALIFMAHLFDALFERAGVPDVLPLMVLGLIIGPILKLVGPDSIGAVGPVFSSIALVVLLFQSGLGLKLNDIKKSLVESLTLTTASFFVTAAIVAALSVIYFGLPLTGGILLGLTVGGTSSAVVIPLLTKLDLSKRASTMLLLESTISDVLCIVGALTVLQVATRGTLNPGKITGEIVASFAMAMVIGFVFGVLWSYLLNFFHELENAILTTPAFVCIVYAITSILGFSGPIAALSFGIAIGNIRRLSLPRLGELLKLDQIDRQELEKSLLGRTALNMLSSLEPKKQEELSKITPSGLHWLDQAVIGEFTFIVKTFFFVYLGICIQLSDMTQIFAGLFTVAWIYFARIFIVRLCSDDSMPSLDAVTTAVMAPKGLASAVVASLAVQEGLPYGPVVQNVAYSVIMFSTILTAVLVFILHRKIVPEPYALVLGSAPKDPGQAMS